MNNSKKQIEEVAKEMRREYYRKWRKENPEKVKQYLETYWMRKAAEEMKKG